MSCNVPREMRVAGHDIPATARCCTFKDAVVARICGYDIQRKIRLHYSRALHNEGDEFINLRLVETKLGVGKHTGYFPQKGGRKIELGIAFQTSEKDLMRTSFSSESRNDNVGI